MNLNYFRKKLHLRDFTVFWIRLRLCLVTIQILCPCCLTETEIVIFALFVLIYSFEIFFWIIIYLLFIYFPLPSGIAKVFFLRRRIQLVKGDKYFQASHEYVGARWLSTFRILWRYKTKFTKNTRRKNEYHLIWTEKLLLICYMLPPLERFANFWSKTKISGESNCFLLADNIHFCHNVFLEHK